jgi:hypothetical protein
LFLAAASVAARLLAAKVPIAAGYKRNHTCGEVFRNTEGEFMKNLVLGMWRPETITKEVVDGDHKLEIFLSGNVSVEIHWQRVIAP